MFLVCGCMALQQNLFRIMRFIAGEYKLSNKKLKMLLCFQVRWRISPILNVNQFLAGFSSSLPFSVLGENLFNISLLICVDVLINSLILLISFA